MIDIKIFLNNKKELDNIVANYMKNFPNIKKSQLNIDKGVIKFIKMSFYF